MEEKMQKRQNGGRAMAVIFRVPGVGAPLPEEE